MNLEEPKDHPLLLCDKIIVAFNIACKKKRNKIKQHLNVKRHLNQNVVQNSIIQQLVPVQ